MLTAVLACEHEGDSPQPCPETFRHSFLNVYLKYGDHIRQEVGDDLILISALRSLLPRYAGPAMTLYRGEGALNRKRRTYGLAWTSSRDVARSHASLFGKKQREEACCFKHLRQPRQSSVRRD
jgi:hypothetical protein